MSARTSETSFEEDEEWCCKRRKYVFVHKYRGRYCRKIVTKKNKVLKGILRNETKVKPALRVSFDENDQVLTADENNIKDHVHLPQHNPGLSKPLKTSFNVNCSNQGRRCTSTQASCKIDEKNQGLLEYESFEQPTIFLSVGRNTPGNLDTGDVISCDDSVTSEQLMPSSPFLNEDESEITWSPEHSHVENVTCSPDCMKLNRRFKRRRSFECNSIQHRSPDRLPPSEIVNVLTETKTMRNSIPVPAILANQCNSRWNAKVDNMTELGSLHQTSPQKEVAPIISSPNTSYLEKIMNISFDMSSDTDSNSANNEMDKENGLLCNLFDPL